MLTNNYSLDLMLPSQPNKDVVFNEAITKIDSFCNFGFDFLWWFAEVNGIDFW